MGCSTDNLGAAKRLIGKSPDRFTLRDDQGGKGEMIKTPINLQELRRRIYLKAKSDKNHRFWGIYVHLTRTDVLYEAYKQARRNGGKPGIDGQSFKDIESYGVENFIKEIRKDLLDRTYSPSRNLLVEIPKGNGKNRILQIPRIYDRVVQGAMKIILECIFEADFCENSYGFRPSRSPHRAIAEVRRSILRRMNMVIDVDLSKYFDTIRHHVLLGKFARRIQDPEILKLIKIVIKANGNKIGVPQGGPFSPLASNLYLNDLDWYFDELREKTSMDNGKYEAINYHRFADDIVITVSNHPSKTGWCERVMQRLKEHLELLEVRLNRQKTKIINFAAGEAFGFLGFDFRKGVNRKNNRPFVVMTPKKDKRKEIKAKIRDIIRASGYLPIKEIISKINLTLRGWVNYFRVGNSSKTFSEIREYLEFKIRTLLTRRKRRRKTSVGWRRWSNEYLYGVLKLFWDWKLQYLKPAEAYK